MRSLPRTPVIALLAIAVIAAAGISGRALRAQGSDELEYRITLPMVAADSATGSSSSFAVYFFLDTLNPNEGGPFLVPVHREVPQTVAIATAALNTLFSGPDYGERTSVPAISSTVPADTRLLGISIANGVATVNLSSEFEEGGGSASVLGRLAQLVFTLTQFPTVDSVNLLIEGEPASPFSSEGVIIDEPLTREDFLDFVPPVLVEMPRYGGPAGNPLRMTGIANVFEASFMVTLVNNAGLIIYEAPVMATCGTGCWGTFDVTIPYTVTSEQLGSLITWVASAQDGSQVNVREYPVRLVPAN